MTINNLLQSYLEKDLTVLSVLCEDLGLSVPSIELDSENNICLKIIIPKDVSDQITDEMIIRNLDKDYETMILSALVESFQKSKSSNLATVFNVARENLNKKLAIHSKHGSEVKVKLDIPINLHKKLMGTY